MQFILADVTKLNGTQYWELADYLKKKHISFTDIDFNEEKENAL